MRPGGDKDGFISLGEEIVDRFVFSNSGVGDDFNAGLFDAIDFLAQQVFWHPVFGESHRQHTARDG